MPYCFWNMLLDAFLKPLSSATYVPTITVAHIFINNHTVIVINNHYDSRYVGRTTQRLQERIKQHVPKAIRQKTSQPTRTQPNRKCKAKSKTQFEPENDSAIGQHLLESNQCARNYSDSQFKILTTARSQFHLSLLEAVYISRIKPDLCRQKQFVFTLQLFR